MKEKRLRLKMMMNGFHDIDNLLSLVILGLLFCMTIPINVIAFNNQIASLELSIDISSINFVSFPYLVLLDLYIGSSSNHPPWPCKYFFDCLCIPCFFIQILIIVCYLYPFDNG